MSSPCGGWNSTSPVSSHSIRFSPHWGRWRRSVTCPRCACTAWPGSSCEGRRAARRAGAVAPPPGSSGRGRPRWRRRTPRRRGRTTASGSGTSSPTRLDERELEPELLLHLACGLQLRRRRIDADRPRSALARARPRGTPFRNRARGRRVPRRHRRTFSSDSGMLEDTPASMLLLRPMPRARSGR